MSTPMIPKVRRTLGRAPILRSLRQAYWTGRFHTLRRFARSWRDSPGGLPVPPTPLRFLVSGIPDHATADFLDMGQRCAQLVQDSLRRHGQDPHRLRAILDFGCGCGRVIRHFAHLSATRVHGTDYNPALVGWCRPNLAFARFRLNHLEPPLPYSAAAFDLVCAFSVFTHLPEPLQHAWTREMARILLPGGFLALTTMPPHLLPAQDVERFKSGQLVVVGASEAGTNDCAAFHPYAYMRDQLATAFEILERVEGAVGQDFWLLRKRLS